MSKSSSKSLTPIISEEDFLPLVQRECQGMFSILCVLNDTELRVNKLYYFTLLQECEKFEGFLDDHGARANITWLYFIELVASIRNFSLAGFHLLHLLDRYTDYFGVKKDSIRREFEKGAEETLGYFSRVLRRFYNALLEAADKRGISIEPKQQSPETWNVKITPQLPYNIYSDKSADESERVISLAQSYRHVYKTFRQNRLHRKIRATDLGEIIPGKVNETLMAEIETSLHNIQSEYDTHIRGGAIEKANEYLPTLRGLTAIPMHLLEMSAWLVHFYERHENQVRKSDVKAMISSLVDNDTLLYSITNFGLHYCNRYLAEGNEIAERILSAYVKPISYKLPIPQPQGFHARPATYVSLIVQEHGTDVFMIADGKKFNCRSVLDLIEAGGALADAGEKTVVFEGDKRALNDLKILAKHNYCEDQEIPKQLAYLRILRNL